MSKYIKDKLWIQIKSASYERGFKDDWLKIIGFYNFYEGEHVQLFITDKDTRKRYRAIGVTDNDNLAICIDTQNNELTLIDKDEATIMRKTFIYNSKPSAQKKLVLENGLSSNSNQYCKYFE